MLEEKERAMGDKERYLSALSNEINMLGHNLEARMANHHIQIEDFKMEKRAIQENCESLNLKIPHHMLHLRRDELCDYDDEFNSLKRRLTKVRPNIIQICLDDLKKVDKQVNHDRKYVLMWDRTHEGTVNN